ncbi:MAG: ABC transporter ATP-binding protein [Burkholderiales bacterium]
MTNMVTNTEIKPMAKPLLVQGITKTFANQLILEDISFSIETGEVFGLVGLNGAGKTTLLKLMLQLLFQDKGTIAFFGEDVRQASSRRHITYLPEKFTPSPFLKGLEFLNLSLSAIGKSASYAQLKAAASAVDLNPAALDARVANYSKGMGQKLGLMSVFLSEAPLLLLDEPMSGLDPSARVHLKAQILEQKQQQRSVFFSSHLLSDIDELCDRIAVLHAGKLIYIGTPDNFRERFHASSLEAAFLQAIA